MDFIILFIILNIANVIIQTIKSIVTIKCGKTIASIVSAVAYGLYTYVVIFTAVDGINIHLKALITAGANLVGVFVVKLIEEKKAKDKLWKVELAVPCDKLDIADRLIADSKIPYNVMLVGDWVMFNAYCETKADTHKMSEVAKMVGGKISAYESKAVF